MTSLPAWVDVEAWAAFVEMRRSIKKPLTPRGEARILKRLQALHDAGQDVNESLDQSSDLQWQDVYPVKALEVKRPERSDYELTQERLRREAARKGAPPPAAILQMRRRA